MASYMNLRSAPFRFSQYFTEGTPFGISGGITSAGDNSLTGLSRWIP